ncbi:pseudaminic acid synthase [Thalassotalea sp. G2M2-11]|uniref:pseudaminic acid synthase n=1 Tax=Thalassotalea sp. G2M2-11 TaxID=2787627 RepID=UPI0019CF59D6|nr:pseudaminic acid synthase [Thalassotalea sp. G2M2-11]
MNKALPFEVEIAGRRIGRQHKPFVIAELSGNHSQSLELAFEMVEAAAKAGVDAIKLQTYTADTMTLDCDSEDFQILENDNLWQGNSLHNLYQKAYTPWEWHRTLFNKAKELGLIAFSSPFDISAVDFLESLDVPCYKIASFENNDIPLIKRIAQTGKPVIMSTGMASLTEISEAVDTLRVHGCSQIVLLKCTSAYPASPAEANLKTIEHLRQTFNCQVGISDHTLSVGVALTGVALGATVIEKHFVLSRAAGGVDAEFSLEPYEFKFLVQESEKAAQAVGKVLYGGARSEQASKKYRRSIYIAKDVVEGEVLTAENIRVVRPGLGLAPKHYTDVIGQQVQYDLKKGTALSWEHFKK